MELYLLRDQAATATVDVRRLAGTRLLYLALAHRTGTQPGDWQLAHTATGARVVVDGPAELPAVSLAHSGDWLVAAVGDAGPIGVDIERYRMRRHAAIAHHLAWPATWWACDGVPTADEFLHLWTLWESLVKAMTDGGHREVRAAFDTRTPAHIAGATGAVAGDGWAGWSWQCPGRFWLSVVVRPGPLEPVRPFRVDTLAADVESARIRTITAPEGRLHS